jgi:hypothetical protein
MLKGFAGTSQQALDRCSSQLLVLVSVCLRSHLSSLLREKDCQVVCKPSQACVNSRQWARPFFAFCFLQAIVLDLQAHFLRAVLAWSPDLPAAQETDDNETRLGQVAAPLLLKFLEQLAHCTAVVTVQRAISL